MWDCHRHLVVVADVHRGHFAGVDGRWLEIACNLIQGYILIHNRNDNKTNITFQSVKRRSFVCETGAQLQLLDVAPESQFVRHRGRSLHSMF